MAVGSPTKIRIGPVELEGNLQIVSGSTAIVIFAHGSGSSMLSPRNNYVAQVLIDSGFSTLLFDLLTIGEDENFDMRFQIPLLTERLVGVTEWISRTAGTRGTKVGYFGASTGAAAALEAAARLPEQVGCVVSRGGRPDLAWEELPRVRSPTLLIVGSLDTEVVELNRKALDRIPAIKRLEVVPGASHLFEERGTLEKVAQLAAQWFKKYL